MKTMDEGRPIGRFAVALAGWTSLACLSLALAMPGEARGTNPVLIGVEDVPLAIEAVDTEGVDATESSWIEVNELTAQALFDARLIEFIEVDERGNVMYAMAVEDQGSDVVIVVVSGGGGPVITPIGQRIPGIAPVYPGGCPAGWVRGPGGTCINRGWQIYDYPPKWTVTSCTGPDWAGYVTCVYQFQFEFIRLSATPCNPLCGAPQVCVEYVNYTATCTNRRVPIGECGDDCSCCPSTPLGPGSGGCVTPTVLPQHPGISPGSPLPGFTVTKGTRCYTPGAAW